MNDYYNKRHLYYSSYRQGVMPYERNGFDEYPLAEYKIFVKAINRLREHSLKILDIGCGTALLLKHIYLYSNKIIIPYGLDFVFESILEAKKSVFPEFSNNFFCINAINYNFSDQFDLVIFDPSILMDSDRMIVFKKIIKSKAHYCIIFSYSDVIQKMNLSSAMDFLNTKGYYDIILSINTDKISLCLIDLEV